MNQASLSPKPVILVAPLNWGLGHATRCIPVIRSLLQNGARVIVAADGAVKILLEQEFPMISFIILPGYQISYSSNKLAMPFRIVSQIPKILSGIKYENERLKALVDEHQITGIISDNRYGLYHHRIPSVFIGHQLLIKTPFGNQTDLYLQQLNYRYINRFTECWVPDSNTSHNLAGELAHPVFSPRIPLKYIGPLSRFLQKSTGSENHLLFIVSGPEPQRTIFEKICVEQLKVYKGPVILVRGIPGGTTSLKVSTNITVHNHLPGEALEKYMSNAAFVIARCGYSTVMDLAILKKKSILIPTPGQTEQEYLSDYLMKTQFAFCVEQNKFKLLPLLELASKFQYRTNEFQATSHLEDAVKGFLKRQS